MRKAALVLATSVAFLLFAASHSYAGTKKKVQMPTAQSVANGSGVPVKSGNSLSIPGALQGEFIPGDNPSRTTPIKVLPTVDFSIPRTINAAKGILKNNAATILLGGTIAGLLAGIDGIIEGSEAKIKTKDPVLNPDINSMHWAFSAAQSQSVRYPSPQVACQTEFSTFDGTFNRVLLGVNRVSDTQYTCHYRLDRTDGSTVVFNNYSSVFRFNNTCTPPSYYDDQSLGCITSTSRPMVPADFDLLDSYANAQSSDWLRDLLRESCEGSISPARCYDDLKDNVSLTGPSTVIGPTSISTTTGPNGTTTKETKTTYQITYGSDYFIYAPTTTTTTVNPDGTTEVETEEETTEEEAQQEELDTSIPDLYKPVVDKYDSISSDVSDAQGPGSGITWGPWYSFGGSCTEIEAQLPIIGFWSTNYCPYIYNLVRPVLMFLFVVFTWHYCKEMFQEAIEKGRPV